MPALLSPKKLANAIRASDARLRPFRERRAEAVADFCGRLYGAGDNKRRIVNLVHRHAAVLVAHLAAGNPTNDVRTSRMERRAEALLLGLALDHLDRELDRVSVSRRLLLDGLLGPCMVARVGLRAGAEVVTIEGRRLNRGQPYVRRVSLDDLIYDASARHDDECLFMGERYRVFRERAIQSGVFAGKEDALRRLPGVEDTQFRGDEKVENQYLGDAKGDERFGLLDTIELCDVAVYDDGVTYMVTIPADPNEIGTGFLAERVWEGPEGGPFVKRDLIPAPDQPFGVPPVAQAIEQAELANETLNKLAEQISQLKAIWAYKGGAVDAARKAQKAKHGELVRMQDPQNDLVAKVLDSVTPGLEPFSRMLIGLWNEQTGGVQVLGGQSGGAQTATEYAGMASTAGLLVGDLGIEHERFETEITRRLAFFLRNDPLIELPMVYRLPGGEMIEVRYSPTAREDDDGDFTFAIRTMSMRAERQDPNVRARRVVELVSALGNVAQVSAITGGMIDFGGTVRVLAREFGIEELDEIVGDGSLFQMTQMLYQRVPGQVGGDVAGRVPGMTSQSQYRIRPAGVSDRRTTPIGETRSALTVPFAA